MLKKKSRKSKGMTLVEVIVSLAVFSIMTLVLVRASSAINLYIRSANHVNRTVAEQSPVAEVGQKDMAAPVETKVQMIFILKGDGPVVVEGNAYEVSNDPAVTTMAFGGDLNMQFFADYNVVTTVAGP